MLKGQQGARAEPFVCARLAATDRATAPGLSFVVAVVLFGDSVLASLNLGAILLLQPPGSWE